MNKTIWLVETDRATMLDIQRKLNTFGGIRTMCIASEAVLGKVIEKYLNQGESLSAPSLILVNYRILEDSPNILEIFKSNPHLAGVPLFFMVEAGEDVNCPEYYLQGAMVVLEKPLNQNMLFRIQQAAGQYEITKSYERIFQKQISELAAAKEIQRLNVQLESRNKFLHKVFGRYFSDEVLEMIMEKQDGEFIGGSRVPMAVLMADLRGFSSKSEQMELNELMELLNYFFGTMAEIITKYNGTIIELMGDGILAVFGALIKNEKYTEAAIASAIEMQNEMEKINEFCVQKKIPKVEMGIGIHCGKAFVGNVGSERMMRYNVIGRTVNECSRIESCTIGGQVFISEAALNLLSCHAQIESTSCIEAKGIKRPLQIYEVSGLDGTYECKLKEKEKEMLYIPSGPMILELFQIANKKISEKKTVCLIKEINTQDVILEVKNEESMIGSDSLSVFTDVEVRAGEENGQRAFVGVYAKLLKINGTEIRLHFTHLNEELKAFVNNIKHTRIAQK